MIAQAVRLRQVVRARLARVAQARGSVTAEFAIALPAVLALAGAALLLGGAMSARLQCESAAHVAARQAMVDPNSGDVAATAHRIAGRGAAVSTSRSGDWVSVRVARSVGAAWFSVRVEGEASAKVEPQWSG